MRLVIALTFQVKFLSKLGNMSLPESIINKTIALASPVWNLSFWNLVFFCYLEFGI